MEVLPHNSSPVRYWFLKLVPAALVILTALLYFETTKALYVRWIKWDESLSHGLIIIGLFFYFLFSSSPLEIRKDPLLLRCFSLLALGLSSAIWYLSNLINLYIIEQLSLLAIVICLLVAVFGIQVLQQHFKLLLLPIFAIPVWDQLTDPLVNLSGMIVGEMVRLIKLPAVIDSNSIFIPYGEIVIADGCSGLRYLTISLAIAYIISYLNGYSLKKLFVSLIIATLIGLAANWLRIFILVIVGYESEMQSSLMNDHEYFGWALFALILFPAIYFAPVVKRPLKEKVNLQSKPVFLAALAILSFAPILNHLWSSAPVTSPMGNKIPHSYNPILGNRMPIKVKVLATDKTENAVTSHQVYVQINQFQRKTRDDKLVPYIPRLYDHVTWSRIKQLKIKDDENIDIQIFRNKHNGIIVAQAQWFDVAGMITSNYTTAKLLQIPAVISGKNNFAIVTLQSVCKTSDCLEETNHIQNVKKTLTAIN